MINTPFSIKNHFQIHIFLMLLILLYPFAVEAASMKQALDKAAEYFVKSAVRIDSGKKVIITNIVNFNSRKHDALGRKIGNELYFAMERQSPDYKLYVGKIEPDQVCISGTYETRGGQTVVKLQAFRGCGKPEVLGQIEVAYFVVKKQRKTLVAVLDIESRDLNPIQIKGFSEIFRSELDRADKFSIASSADVYKFDPDAVQKATGCTRDECANIIGEQMGVDRVISSSLFKITDDQFILSGKILNIQTGEIVVSRTVDHSGNLGKFKDALSRLAKELTGAEAETVTPEPPMIKPPPVVVEKSPVFKPEVVEKYPDETEKASDEYPEQIIEEDDGWSWWVWAAIGAGVAAVAAVAGGDSGGDDGGGDSGGGGTSGSDGSALVTW